MRRSLALRNIYVEGDDDVAVLSRWFPRLQFKASGGKDQVRKQVEQDPAGYGLLDRDFASWEGLQRWSHGKVVLEGYLFPRVFETLGLSQSRLRDLLIEAGKRHIPVELEALARRWASGAS